jgi:transposase-like protein
MHRGVADSLEAAGDSLFAFTCLPPSQWKSARTTNAIERLHEEFKRRIKTQTVLPSAETAVMLFWAFACVRTDQHPQEFVARMEDVLDLYAEEPDLKRRWSVSMKVRPSSSARSASR